MPRIVKKATASAISAAPREFSLLVQASKPAGDDYALDDTALAELVGGLTLKDTNEFADFAQAVKKTGAAVEGQGNAIGWAARDTSGALAPYKFMRRPVGEHDVHIQITHAGICHSDIHTAKGEWGPAKYPLVPGHEIVGIVTEVGAKVTKFKVGQRAGVGCFVDSCRSCDKCSGAGEQYCSKAVYTYNSVHHDGSPAQGGYSTHITIHEYYALHVPDNLKLAGCAPLLCAGITVWSPIKYYGMDKPGMKIGVVGLGGLGHMAVKFLAALGCEPVVISRSDAKKAEALALGAKGYLVSGDAEAMKAAAGTLHGIVDCVAADHDVNALFSLLDVDGKLVLVGAPACEFKVNPFSLLMRRITFGGSLVGNIKDTQEMLDFCGKHNVTADVEVIDVTYVNDAWKRVEKGDVKFRFVIDVQKTLLMDA